MNDYNGWYLLFMSGSVVAIVNGIFTILQKVLEKRGTTRKALRFLLLSSIQQECREHIRIGQINSEDLKSIHEWYDLYHNDLGGNGYIDSLIKKVDNLPIKEGEEK